MKDVPLIEQIKNYVEEGLVPFSMPGHKMGRAFESFEDLFLKGDLTEVDGLDNLHKPEGVIKEVEDKLSVLYKSKKSYLLVNGSTCGNLIMMFSAFKEGDSVLVERNCHRSIMNGVIMRKLKPVFIKNKFHDKLKAPIGIDIDHLEELININKDIKGIVLTYPNYYGIGLGIDYIIDLCKNKGLKVLVDSAHGAHFGFNENLPKNPQELGANITVMSSHKTLPSLTQTAWIHVNDEVDLEKVEFYKSIFMSTSPSYAFMMSMDYARSFLENEADKRYQNLMDIIENFKKGISHLSYLKVVDKNYLCLSDSKDCFDKKGLSNKYKVEFDSSRIILNLEDGFSGNKLYEYLRKNKIQCEMSDYKNVVLIPSPFNTEQDFYILLKALIKCNKDILKDTEKEFYISDIPNTKLLPHEVIDKQKEYLDLDFCLGKTVGENIIPYPPGVPLLVMGEIIEKKHIDIIKDYIKEEKTVIGIENNKLKVVKI